MARAGMTRADVIKAGPIDNKTLQSVLEGERRSSAATRAKIENALNLEPGTLGAVDRGELPTRRTRRKVSDTELIAMLAERLAELRAEVEHLHKLAGDNNVTQLDEARSPFDPAVNPLEPNGLRSEPYLIDEAARRDTGQPSPGEGDD